MPIYAYRCETCGFQKDVLQKMSDPLLVTCPSCGASTFRKQVTAAGFQLKGSGWYVTDFRNPASKDGAKSTKADPSSDSGSKSEGSGETKSTSPDGPAPVPAPAPTSTESKNDGGSSTSKSSPTAPPSSGST
jgi:putative FmdB family regulatory protein